MEKGEIGNNQIKIFLKLCLLERMKITNMWKRLKSNKGDFLNRG